jgi:hypothetical protein
MSMRRAFSMARRASATSGSGSPTWPRNTNAALDAAHELIETTREALADVPEGDDPPLLSGMRRVTRMNPAQARRVAARLETIRGEPNDA